MAFRIIKKSTALKSIINAHFHLGIRSFSYTPTRYLLVENKGNSSPTSNDVFNLSPLFSDGGETDLRNCRIEVVDDERWNVSSGLAEAWRVNSKDANARMVVERKALFSENEEEDGVVNYVPNNKKDPDFDEIEDMRIRGNLYYKLDKHSKEYEEHKFDFHRRKPSDNKNDKREEKAKKKESARSAVVSGLGADDHESFLISRLSVLEDSKKKENSSAHASLGEERISLGDKDSYMISRFHGLEGYDFKKKRTPTFNQLTAPYHEPFCLDIYVSKGSARASVIHRATSKVVAVAHSISKDLKFDLGSPKSRNACALVGKVLAQRALDDDIHNVVYTPRKGEKLEGKLQIVLQAIIDGGVEVKVKLKQRKLKKTARLPSKVQHQY